MKSLVLVQYCINLRGTNVSPYSSQHDTLLMKLLSRPQKEGVNLRHRCLRHFDSRSLQVFLQSRIELIQASEFEVRHRLFLVPHITARLISYAAAGISSKLRPRQEVGYDRQCQMR